MLYLLPNTLDDDYDISSLSLNLKDIISTLDAIICESRKVAIRYLLKFLKREEANNLPIYTLNEHTKKEELDELLSLISKKKVGLLSDAGLPCIADPGSSLVFLANKNNIKVKASFGPSSIFLSLMLSGLNSQKFYFHGYLPKQEDLLIKKLKKIEKEILLEHSSQVFIETPYRSDRLLKFILSNIDENVYLSISINLTKKDEKVITKKIREFKKINLIINKNPAVFVLGVR
ncbi:MAG: Ribosomal RNA small subunit methyltransferase I [Candidatus Anoxychlamydiales bacterium]|nr:Ribosomal RNA small subunit methyltransferase I [Candidatus Anoxychlamydiales bacterium]